MERPHNAEKHLLLCFGNTSHLTPPIFYEVKMNVQKHTNLSSYHFSIASGNLEPIHKMLYIIDFQAYIL